MKLYGSYTSPYVRHCRISLLETKLPFDFVEVDATDAENPSPTRKVPYFEDGDVHLSESSSILRFVREKAGGSFLPQVSDLDVYAMSSTLMDAAINVFYFEKFDKMLPESSVYLTRQKARVERGLLELDRLALPGTLPKALAGGATETLSDAHLRIACFLGWGLFRQRFSLESYPNLLAFFRACDSYEPFAATAPPS